MEDPHEIQDYAAENAAPKCMRDWLPTLEFRYWVALNSKAVLQQKFRQDAFRTVGNEVLHIINEEWRDVPTVSEL
jgi:hypothetical protein